MVREWLPDPPARVLELGCGPLGGLVPMLLGAGYEAIGVDPAAPEGEEFRRVEFERLEPVGPLDAVVASASLHHVADPASVLDGVARVLEPTGRVIVVEWDWQAFDRSTAEWCFRRLGPDPGEGEHEHQHDDWLRRHRDEWRASRAPWHEYLAAWAARERIHPAGTLLRLLDERFRRERLETGPYFFADLPGTTQAEERAAIDAGEIRATRIDVVARPR